MNFISPFATYRPKPQRAFTLVELLVVITIIGILIALLLPAVQAAREAARKLQCTNHLKQMGLAMLQHEEIHNHFPSAGWNCWVGEPTRGFGQRQPGGWLYNILPYLEMQSLHDLGINDGLDASEERPGFDQRISTPIATFICPSRRQAIVYPSVGWERNIPDHDSGKLLGHSDYAASGGDTYLWTTSNIHGPESLAVGDAMNAHDWAELDGTYSTGVFYQRSWVRMADVTDGTSNTYLAGEKYLSPDNYSNGTSTSDNMGWDIGWTCDGVRWSGKTDSYSRQEKGYPYCCMQPMQDTPGYNEWGNFGSAHASGFNMVFCDGSVHSISYSINLWNHHYLGNIADGVVIDFNNPVEGIMPDLDPDDDLDDF